MALQIKKAVKHDAKLRMSIAGPSGAGKTWTALTLAEELADGKPVLVVDTERGSASKYADIFNFDVIELESFSPTFYIEAIKLAEANGYSVLILDSLSHAWNGIGGLLELVDSIAKRKYGGNSFAAWKDATPLQNQLIDAITRANVHVIATMRSKQEYALEKDERTGKTSPKKVGMAAIQRDGMEYEFDVAVDMDVDNAMIVQKSRCPQLSGQVIAKPGADVARVLKSWLSGAPAPAPAERPTSAPTAITSQEVKEVYDECVNAGMCSNKPGFYNYASTVLGLNVNHDNVMALTHDQLNELRGSLIEEKVS